MMIGLIIVKASNWVCVHLGLLKSLKDRADVTISDIEVGDDFFWTF